jgi:hypothetical protein
MSGDTIAGIVRFHCQQGVNTISKGPGTIVLYFFSTGLVASFTISRKNFIRCAISTLSLLIPNPVVDILTAIEKVVSCVHV